MPIHGPDGLSCRDTDRTEENKPPLTKAKDVAPKDRRQQVLAVLEQSGVAMRSIDVFRNCKLRGGTFEHRTTKNYLTQLIDSGDVLKVDSNALGDGEIVEIDTGERGHFIAASAADEFAAE